MNTPNQLVACSLGLVLATLVARKLLEYWDYYAKLSVIPTVGHNGLLSSYISGFKFFKHGAQILEEGYKKHPAQAFKVPLFDRWMVIVTGRDMIEDLRKAKDDELSFNQAMRQTFHDDFTGTGSLSKEPYHVDIVQGPLTRNMANMFGEVYDELTCAFNDEIPQTDDWVKIPTLQRVLNVVCRTSNRLFVGLPLCRNDDWKALNISYTIDFFVSNAKVSFFPRFIQPLVAWYTTPFWKNLKRAMVHLRPIIRDRLRRYKVGEELENDLITWLIQSSPQKDNISPEEIGKRLLILNMAAIHTTGQALTHALINIAIHPEYVAPLREEVEEAIRTDGWSKAAMGKMRKLDSFLKESQRVSSSPAAALRRLAMKEFVFSDGTVIPKGAIVSTSPSAIHHDENLYENPHVFDGFRSYNKRLEEGESLKHAMVTPGVDYVAFGAGKHACPGRFFAVNELKAFFSHTLLYYDVKLDEADVPAKTERFGMRVHTNSKTQVMMRRRQDKN
ncbi:cytochrome P450 [Marasmius fiardii PR-910]|nr:cytochrome P450 [Marasmius fiardii PR-910]